MAIEPLHCLFCLKQVDNNERSNYDCFNEHTAKRVSPDTTGSLLYSKFIKFVREYLKLEGDDNPLFSNNCSVSVGLSQFCVCCEYVISTICRLYSHLLEAQLRLSWKLGELGELLEGSEQRVSFKLWNVLIKLVGSQLSFKGGVVVEATHVKEFRGGLQGKCAQKGKGNLPSIIVERISVPIESFQRRSGVDGASSSVPWIAEIDDDGKTQDDEASFKRTTSTSKPVENDDDDIKVEMESVLGDYEGEDHYNEDCWGADVTDDNLNEDEDYEDYNVSGPGQSHPHRFRRITRRKRQRMQLKGWGDDGDDCSTIENNVDTESIKMENDSGSEVNFDSTSENDSGSDWSEGTTDRKKSKKPTTS
ncbi:unnamed protein product [Orchesella dallaii]|uniref:Uncharacterized protein n=1 Tax=Orchesella dallaii TaxID=48710 RepID=A0ABP1RIW2_9HEXA